jgi:hypothetical protein
MSHLTSKIMSEVPSKKIHGRTLTGDAFVLLTQAYLRSLNEGVVPTINSAWDNVVAIQGQKAANESVDIYRRAMETVIAEVESKQVPLSSLEFENIHKTALSTAREHFNRISISSSSPSSSSSSSSSEEKNFFNLMMNQVEEVKALVSTKNATVTSVFCKKLLEQLASPIDSKLKG